MNVCVCVCVMRIASCAGVASEAHDAASKYVRIRKGSSSCTQAALPVRAHLLSRDSRFREHAARAVAPSCVIRRDPSLSHSVFASATLSLCLSPSLSLLCSKRRSATTTKRTLARATYRRVGVYYTLCRRVSLSPSVHTHRQAASAVDVANPQSNSCSGC